MLGTVAGDDTLIVVVAEGVGGATWPSVLADLAGLTDAPSRRSETLIRMSDEI